MKRCTVEHLNLTR